MPHDSRNVDQAAALRLRSVLDRIQAAERRFGRVPGSVSLLAASKAHPAECIRSLAACGQRAFGENYVQEALDKQSALADLDLEWHFIGPVQSNKTRAIASRFAWVHSVDRIKIARRLGEQRPLALPDLNVCIEVNVSAQASKSGVAPRDVADFARAITGLPRLRLRGLMAIPAPAAEFDAQRAPLAALASLQRVLNDQGLGLDTLSMGMTDDLEAAVAEGATVVRIGSALFGPRA